MLFGLPGVVVVRVESIVDGRVVHVVTADPAAARCPGCGMVSTAVKGWTTTRPKDLPYGEDPLVVVWHKRRWRCAARACARASFTEAIGEVPARARTTGRLRRAIGAAVENGRSVTEAGGSYGVSWHTAQRATTAWAALRLAEIAPTRLLGIDETRFGRPRWLLGADGKWVRVEPWETGFVDLRPCGQGGQGLLGQVDGRGSAAVIGWLNRQSPEFRDAIEIVALDPSAPYAVAVREALPDAKISVDHFHLVMLANKAVTAVRQRVTRDLLNRRGRKSDPVWAGRRRLLRARERLSPKAFTRMWNDLITHDPTGQILAAWIAKEELRALLACAKRGASRDEIRHRLWAFYSWCADAGIDELTTLATTIETWWPAIEVFLRTTVTNAKTEGTNRLVKQVKRAACGFRNRDNYRQRVRLHCTRSTRQPKRRRVPA